MSINTPPSGTNAEEIITNEQGSEGTASAAAEGESANQAAGLGAQGAEGEAAEGEVFPGLGETEDDVWAKDYVGKPEAYDYTEILPEGWNLNEELSTKFNDIAGKYNMANKGANEIMALAVDLAKQTQDGVLSAQSQATEANRTKFNEAVMNDKEIGGSKLDETMRIANVAYSEFIQKDPEAHNLFCQTALNGHPAVVKMFYTIGKQMSDATLHSGSAPGGEQTREQIMYPELANK